MSAPADATTQAPGLWRHRPFQIFLTARGVAIAGYAITEVALPLLVFQLSGSAFLTASVAAIAVVPYLVFGLVAGALADRMNRRRIMVTCQVSGALTLASVPLAASLDALVVGHVLAVAVVLHTAFVWFDAACFGALPAIVGRRDLVRANTAVFTTSTLVDVTFPAVGGLLIAAVGPAYALGGDALAALTAAALLSAIPMRHTTSDPAVTPRHPSGPQGPAGIVRRTREDIREGLRYLWGHQLIRALSVFGFGQSVTAGAVTGLLVVYAVEVIGWSSDDGSVALAFVLVAAGGVGASLLLPRLSSRVPVGWITIGAFGLSTPLVIGLALAPAGVAPVLLPLWSATSVLAIINGISTRQLLTPDGLQSRVNTTARMIAWGGAPVGALLGGFIAEVSDVRTAYLVMSVGVAVSAVLAAVSPLRHRRLMDRAANHVEVG